MDCENQSLPVSNKRLPEKEVTTNTLKDGLANLGYEDSEKPESIIGHQITATTKNVDFDDLIPHFGNFGKSQIILFLWLGPFTVFYVFVYFTQIFIMLTPLDFWCRVPELQDLNLNDRIKLSIPTIDGEISKCTMYNMNYTELLLNNVTEADPFWPTQTCIFGYEFDHSEIPYTTIATELGWVCENDALPTISLSVFFCGAFTGGLLFGWIADRFGRVPALVGSNFVGGIAGIATAFANSFWTFTLCRYFAGFAFDSCYTIMYILALEYVGPKWRTFVANMGSAIYFGIGALLMPWIAFWISDWKLLTIVLSVPLLSAILTPLVVPESARTNWMHYDGVTRSHSKHVLTEYPNRWLLSQNRIERATNIIRKFERVNKKTVDAEVFSDFLKTCHRNNHELKDKKYSLLDLFKTPRLRRTVLFMIAIYMSVSLLYDGYVRSITSIGLNVFIAFTLASATEFPASFILTFLLDRWGRRWLFFGSMALCGMCSFALSFTVNRNVIASVALMVAGRFCVSWAYSIGQQIAAEYFPTVVRVQGVAFIHNLGYIANMLSPLVMYLQVINPSLPFWILAIVAVIGGSGILFLSETMGKDLPQTLQDAEDFGLNDNFWGPCCVSKPRTTSIVGD